MFTGFVAVQFGLAAGIGALVFVGVFAILSQVQGFILCGSSLVMGLVSSAAIVTVYTIEAHTTIGDMRDPAATNTWLVVAVSVGTVLHAVAVMVVDWVTADSGGK